MLWLGVGQKEKTVLPAGRSPDEELALINANPPPAPVIAAGAAANAAMGSWVGVGNSPFSPF